MNKPKLSYEEQIQHLELKGITFNNYSKEKAKDYLAQNNNLFKLSAYRKNYVKDLSNVYYLHLDFSELVDLATIDMYLRAIIAKMALDIEHFAKVTLMDRITLDTSEDGYSIVTDFLSSQTQDQQKHINSELARNSNSPYCHDAYQKYKNDFPVWVFLEITSFGTFLSFYKFCADRFLLKDQANKAALLQIKNDKQMVHNFYLMLTVKHLRNAAAHNNCIINDLRSKSQDALKKADHQMVQNLSNDSIYFLSRKNRSRKANFRIVEIVTCLYTYKLLVNSAGMQRKASKDLQTLKSRLFKRCDYTSNPILHSSFINISKVIDKWFPII